MKKQLIGFGKVTNGRIFFSTVNGNGFTAPVTGHVSAKATVCEEAPVIQQERESVDLVFDFIHRQKVLQSEKMEEQKSNVIYVNFKEEDDISLPEKALDSALKAGKRVLLPLKNYFF